MEKDTKMETSAKPWWAMEFPQKPWWHGRIMNILVTTAVVICLGVDAYNGEKDPVVNIFDNSIQVTGKGYEAIAYFPEITGISLIEKNMKDIGVGIRVGGYRGFGGTLRGNFESPQGGFILLFVQSRSSPTIWIEREFKKDIYISFRDGKKTEMSYNEMKAAIKKTMATTDGRSL